MARQKQITNKKTTEQRTGDTILQKEISVTLDGRDYTAAPPSVATLILVSELVSTLPRIKTDNTKDILGQVLRIARDTTALGDILATLILGAKAIRQEKNKPLNRVRRLLHIKHQTHYQKLAQAALDLAPTNLEQETARILSSMEVGDFFGFTASLIEINLLRQTREAGTTAFGR